MPPVKSLQKIPIYVWIPPIWNAIYKIEVIHGGIATDVTDIMYEGSFVDGITETIGSFDFTIDNSTEEYTSKFSLSDSIKLYLDYSDTATTEVFEGIIEKLNTKDNKLQIIGRTISAKATGTLVTYSATDTETSEILTTLITKYFSEILTTTNVNVGTVTATINWYQKPFWECVQELCSISGFDAYIDHDYDFHYFESATIDNTTECVVHTSNLIETGDFSPDLSFVKNKIIVTGKVIDGLPILATAEDTASQTNYGLKEEQISDSNISTVAQAQARADYELSIKKDPPIIGEVTSLQLPTIQPGERIRISDPQNGLEPTYYTIQKYEHKFSNDDPPQTVLTVLRERQTISKILKNRLKFEQEYSASDNPNEMEYSQIYEFNDSTGTFTNATFSQGFLKTTGGATGTWVSPVISLLSNATGCEVRSKGSTIEGTTYEVSADNGINWQSIAINTSYTLAPPGPHLKLRINLSSASTQIDTACLLYKT